MKSHKRRPLIGIVGGKGKMGRWFKDFFNSQGFEVRISDLDTKLSNKVLAQKADIVIVSVPIKKTVEVIEEIRDFVRNDALLCDFTSLKIKPVEAMKKAKSGVLGMHPLFGPLVQKLEGQNIVFCRVRDNQWVSFLRNIFLKNGAKILEMSPREHDFQVAICQALLHFTNLALAKTISSQKSLLQTSFTTPSFRLQLLLWGRILSLNPEVLSDLEFENPFFESLLRDYQKEVKELAKDIREKNYKNFAKKFKEINYYLKDYLEIAQAKSAEVLNLIDRKPLKIGRFKERKPILRKRLKIGFLGPKGTFSHQAALILFPSSKLLPFAGIKEIFERVNQREIDIGLVPAENTISGIVPETINFLIEYPLKVSGSYNLPIHHCLLSWGKSKSDLKIIKTHYQAFSQSRNWLEKNLPRVHFENSQSTTAPILEKLETKDKTLGFIANEIAAKEYNLNILAKNIEDSKENITKFYLISQEINKKIAEKLKSRKTLILFAVYDRVGILRDILNVFAENNINLSSLHSIPSRLRPWDYFFFVEGEISLNSSRLKKVLQGIKRFCPIVRIIGQS
ncbi:MAG: prephenate dehydrogenase/arogenate dehydrogenase family protein [Patescibacteria group bacterium]|nr:prephenate dehydrogenase/arogenate dehydrogenase family protein [Patescibacteria group bacterium]